MTIFKQEHVLSNSLCYAVITSKSVLTDMIVANNYSHYWNGLFKSVLSNGYACLNRSHCLQIVTKLFKHICFYLLWVFRTRNSHEKRHDIKTMKKYYGSPYELRISASKL